MKKALTLAFSLITTLTVIAQQEPDFVGGFSYLDNGVSVPLEKQRIGGETKAQMGKALIPVVGLFAKGVSRNIVSGSRSTVRVMHRDSILLLVRVADTSIDPLETVNIFRLESNTKKNNRSVIVGSYSVAQGAKTNSEIEYFPFTAKRFGQSSFVLIVKNLGPGEYALTLEGRRDMFNMFGVE